MASLTQLDQRIRALETQQQTTISNATGQAVLNIGLIPGSNPAQYGLQFVDPSDGSELMFIGEDSMGDISLIGNPALESPLSPAFGSSFKFGFPVPVANPPTTLSPVQSSFTFTTPAGYTQALVSVAVQDSALNTTASTDALVSYVEFGTAGNPHEFYGTIIGADVPAGAFGFCTMTSIGLVTGLTSGEVITVNSRPSSLNANWATNGTNLTAPAGTALFLR